MILWQSYIGGEQSLGIVGQEAVLALDRQGWCVRPLAWNLAPIMRRTLFLSEDAARASGHSWGHVAWAKMPRRLQELIMATETLTIRDERDALALSWGPIAKLTMPHWLFARAYAYYTYYDWTVLRETEVELCNRATDLIFVPSTFVRDTFLAKGVTTPIHVWSHGIDPNVVLLRAPATERAVHISVCGGSPAQKRG